MEPIELLAERRTLPAGSYLYRVRSIRDPQPSRFFQLYTKALVWGALTYLDAIPVPSDRVSLEKFMFSGLDRRTRRFRFPLQSDLVVSEYKLLVPVEYIVYSDGGISEVDFEVAIRDGNLLVAETIMEGTAPLFSDAMVAFARSNQNVALRSNIDHARWFSAFYRALEGAKRAFIEPMLLQSRTIQFSRTDGILYHSFDHYVVWENVMGVLAESMNAQPDLTILRYFEVISYMFDPKRGNQAADLIRGGTDPGYEGCLDNLTGFANDKAGSCFMDSTLMCMFAFKNSPFFENMIAKPILANNGVHCNADPVVDARVRAAIREQLALDVGQLMGGGIFKCSRLRAFLGAQCSMIGENLAEGIHDPSEMYIRLCNALNYWPMVITYDTYAAQDAEGTGMYLSSDNPPAGEVTLPTISTSNPEHTIVSWPTSWEREWKEIEITSGDPKYKWRKDVINIQRADCIAVHINRGYPVEDEEEFIPQSFSRPATLVPWLDNPFDIPPAVPASDPFSSPFVPLPQKDKEEVADGTVDDVLSFFTADPSTQAPSQVAMPAVTPSIFTAPRPTNPSLRRRGARSQTEVNPRSIPVEHEFDVKGTLYILRAAVFSPFEGHYSALLKCGTSWFEYNDLDTTIVLARRRLPLETVQRLLDTRAVLLFYYPPFAELSVAEQEKIDRFLAEFRTNMPTPSSSPSRSPSSGMVYRPSRPLSNIENSNILPPRSPAVSPGQSITLRTSNSGGQEYGRKKW